MSDERFYELAEFAVKQIFLPGMGLAIIILAISVITGRLEINW